MTPVCPAPTATDTAASAHDRRRVLFVSYHFPPVGGAGVQRPVKFVKYLPGWGWQPSVLTAANPSAPVFDDSLCTDLPPDLVIARARTCEPGYRVKQQLAAVPAGGRAPRGPRAALRHCMRAAAGLLLQPDPQVLWLPTAYRAGCQLLSRLPHEVILATAPSYSNLILGTWLKLRTGLPLVVDFRDEWDLSSQYLENSRRDRFSHAVQERMQRWVLRHADAILATTAASARRLQDRARAAGSTAEAQCIYNGFDEVDFQRPHGVERARLARQAAEEPPRFRLVYTGTLWNLTSAAPLAAAVELLRRESPETLARLELVLVGRKTDAQREVVQEITRSGCRVHDADYCDHDQAIDLMQSADGLCLLLSDVPGADRVAPAKLFEYLAAGRPLLAVTPAGETADIVRRFFPAGHYLPGDAAGIARWLRAQVAQWVPGERTTCGRRPPAQVEQFSRRRQAGELAALLDELTPVPVVPDAGWV